MSEEDLGILIDNASKEIKPVKQIPSQNDLDNAFQSSLRPKAERNARLIRTTLRQFVHPRAV